METTQRVFRRSWWFSRFLTVLVCIAVALLLHSVVRENFSGSLTREWPWKLKLLDLQSASACVLTTAGAMGARAQYARAVRPALGYSGRVKADIAPDGQLAWICTLFNGGQDMAVITEVSYWIEFTTEARVCGAPQTHTWMTREEVMRSVRGRGLEHRRDMMLTFLDQGWPVHGQGRLFLGWFTGTAMRELENVFLRLRVEDRVGDTHERTVNLLKGADRSPTHPDPSADGN